MGAKEGALWGQRGRKTDGQSLLLPLAHPRETGQREQEEK